MVLAKVTLDSSDYCSLLAGKSLSLLVENCLRMVQVAQSSLAVPAKKVMCCKAEQLKDRMMINNDN